MPETLSDPRVTIVVVPRERFGIAQDSLQSILDKTTVPYDLIYIQAGGPASLQDWLRAQADAKGFRLIEMGRYVSPNEARNIGWKLAATPYVVFIDNDVIPADHWLEPLVTCADETGADVVCPVTCHGLPLHTRVHQAGGQFTPDVSAFFATVPGRRRLDIVTRGEHQELAEIPPERHETQVCEFHCTLIRRDLMERTGLLDEELLATREHIDFCMGVLASGGKIICEPNSVITYRFTKTDPMKLSDMPYYIVRWSQDWQLRSIARFIDKWGFDPEQPAFQDLKRRTMWHYNISVVHPVARRIPLTRFKAARRVATALVRPAVRTTGAITTALTNRKRRAASSRAQ